MTPSLSAVFSGLFSTRLTPAIRFDLPVCNAETRGGSEALKYRQLTPLASNDGEVWADIDGKYVLIGY